MAARKRTDSGKWCKDCPPGGKARRPTPHPGPRCATHHREKVLRDREAAWAARLWKTYRITTEQYWELYNDQGGRCAICQRATGKAKKLAVDHDHACCNGPTSCGKCVRGLLCMTDNKWLGHIRDSPAAGQRAHAYLLAPPAHQRLGWELAGGP